MSRRATELGKDDPVALCASGHALANVVGDVKEGLAYIDRSLKLNPNHALAWEDSGWVRIYLGEHELAIEHLGRGMRLNPMDTRISGAQAATALAHFLIGRYDEAAAWAEKALQGAPTMAAARIAAASYALAGRLDKAHKAMDRLRRGDPTLRASNVEDRIPPLRPRDLAKYIDGLRKAGLPE